VPLSIRTAPAAAPPRITYDSHCLTVDGRDVLVFSGAFHYFRCPKPLWHDRFQKMKQAGLNTVETYVPWNWHERAEPADVNDFSKVDLSELDEWLKMAEDEFGFYVILRPGPYICAEWDGGGFPQWLMKHRPARVETNYWLRSDEPTYLACSRHWYQAVAKAAIPHLITNRPTGKSGVIMWQVENEYDLSHLPESASLGQVKMLARASRDFGIDVPLFTCMTSKYPYRDDPFLRDNVIETRNCYPGYRLKQLIAEFDFLDRYQPEKFRQISELQGGWFTGIGEQPQAGDGPYSAAQIQHLAIVSLERGVTALNFYMFFGGTNLGDRAPRGIVTSYDYFAPIHEAGGVGERWRAVAAVGQMLAEHGPQLARSDRVDVEVVRRSHEDVSFLMRRTSDGSRFVFVRTAQNREPRNGSATIRANGEDQTIEVQYDLEPFGARVLYLPPHRNVGRWLLDRSAVPMPQRPAPEHLPAAIRITEARRMIDPLAMPAYWRPIAHGQTLEDFDVLDCRYVLYRVPLPAEARSAPSDWGIDAKLPPGDALLAQLDGKTSRDATSSDDGETSIRLDGITSAGDGQLVLLYENGGHPFSGWTGMERRKGIAELRIKPAKWLARMIDTWKVKPVDSVENRPEVAADFDDSSWTSAKLEGEAGHPMQEGDMAVFRATFDSPPTDKEVGPIKLIIGRIDDNGWVYLNGEKIGEAHDWEPAHRFDVTDRLKPGRNLLAVIVSNTEGLGGLSRGVKLEPRFAEGQPLPPSQIATQCAGDRQRWWEPATDDSKWESVKLDSQTTPGAAAPLLTWYRMRFSLSSPQPNIWAPWKIHLDAVGNGMLYLNGHALGRYWQAGPQRDFFLPECWLNFDEGKENVMTVCLRPVDGPVALNAATVSVYADQAELRAQE
jgi:hypothetical protein